MKFFGELVVIRKIKFEGNDVKFIISEKGAGFLFKSHHIAELIVPVGKVDRNLLGLLRRSPNYEIDDVEMILEGRSTAMFDLGRR